MIELLKRTRGVEMMSDFYKGYKLVCGNADEINEYMANINT